MLGLRQAVGKPLLVHLMVLEQLWVSVPLLRLQLGPTRLVPLRLVPLQLVQVQGLELVPGQALADLLGQFQQKRDQMQGFLELHRVGAPQQRSLGQLEALC